MTFAKSDIYYVFVENNTRYFQKYLILITSVFKEKRSGLALTIFKI